jgi:hypothetical protein
MNRRMGVSACRRLRQAASCAGIESSRRGETFRRVGAFARRPSDAGTPTRPQVSPLAELEDITYVGGWLANEFWHWLGI